MRQSIARRLQQSVPTSSMRRSVVLGAAIAAAGLSAPSLALTYTYTPTNTTTDLWSAGTNWSAIPVGATNTELIFGTNVTTFPAGFVNTNTNDISGAFQLNMLTLNGTGPAGGTATINLNGAGSSTGLNFISNGDIAPVINVNVPATVGALVYNVNTPITLTNNLSINGTGSAAVNFTGNITAAGTQNFLIATAAAPVSDSNGTSTLTSGTLQLSGKSGRFTLSSGSFQALNVQNTGNAAIFSQTGGTLTSQSDSRLSLSNSLWSTTGGVFNFNKMVVGANSGTTNTLWSVGGTATVNQNQIVTNNHELWIGGNNGGSGSLVVKDKAVFNAGARLNNGSYYFVIDNGVGNGTVTIQDNAQFIWSGVAGNNSALIRVADLVGNTGTLNSNGNGTLSTLGLSKGAGLGTVNADGGTIRSLATNANFFNNFTGTGGTQSVNLLAGGLKFDTNGLTDTATNVLSGVGGMTKQNSGTLILTGANTYTGNTVVSGGTLLVNGVQSAASGTPTISTAAGATLGGTGTVAGTLNHTAGTITGAGDLIQVNGNLAFCTTPETVNLNFTSATGLPNAFTYKLFGYTGSLSGTPNLLFTSNLGRTQFTTNTANAGEVDVTVSPITGNLV